MTIDRLHIGTSGWNFDDWKGGFYPEDIDDDDLLPCYSEQFTTVELNNSFYQLPDRNTVRDWAKETPAGFRFACKASRFITHMKKLGDPEEHVDLMMDAFEPFGDKLGPILFQCPPSWKVNRSRLENFLKTLPESQRYAFEFRDRSWLCDEVYGLLEDFGAALCFYDYQGYRSPEVPTADFMYLRLHGPGEKAYEGSYDGRTLAGYAKKIARWLDEDKEVYCYFDNDRKACAPGDAQSLQNKVARIAGSER